MIISKFYKTVTMVYWKFMKVEHNLTRDQGIVQIEI